MCITSMVYKALRGRSFGVSNACNKPNWAQIRTAAMDNVEMIR